MNPRAFLFATLITLAMAGGVPSATSQNRLRIGDLAVNFVEVMQQAPQAGSDHHIIFVRLEARNIGKQALCAGFTATLKATFGLEYGGTVPIKNPFRVRELLPGENIVGDYQFYVKNGAEPLQIILKPTSETQTCTPDKDSLSAIWHSPGELKFNISPAPEGATERALQPSRSPGGRDSADSMGNEAATIRVFITGENRGAPKENALKAFQDRCPQARITTMQKNANYLVMLSPASFRHSKNQVTVINSSGDLIHTGTTFNLQNAAKDACTAILKDFRTGSRSDPRNR